MEAKQSILPAAGLTLAALIWGSSFIVFKHTLQFVDPLTLVTLRMAVASIIFIAIYRFWSHFRYRTGDWKYLLIMSLAEPCLYFLFEAWALKLTTASEAGVMTAVLPLLVAVLAGLFLGEMVTRAHWVGLLLTIPGIIWLSVSGESSETAPDPLLGNMLQFCAMLTAAIYTLALKFLSSRYPTLFLTAVQAFIGLFFFLPLAIVFESWPTDWQADVVVGILYLGGVVTLFAYALYNYGVKNLSASVATMYTNLIPVFTLLMAFVFLDERISMQQWLAVGLILLGVGVSQWRQKPPAIPVETF